MPDRFHLASEMRRRQRGGARTGPRWRRRKSRGNCTDVGGVRAKGGMGVHAEGVGSRLRCRRRVRRQGGRLRGDICSRLRPRGRRGIGLGELPGRRRRCGGRRNQFLVERTVRLPCRRRRTVGGRLTRCFYARVDLFAGRGEGRVAAFRRGGRNGERGKTRGRRGGRVDGCGIPRGSLRHAGPAMPYRVLAVGVGFLRITLLLAVFPIVRLDGLRLLGEYVVEGAARTGITVPRRFRRCGRGARWCSGRRRTGRHRQNGAGSAAHATDSEVPLRPARERIAGTAACVSE